MISNARKDGSSVSPLIIAAVVVVLVLMLGLIAHHYFAPPQGQVVALSPQQVSDNDWLRQKVRESGGDLYRLSAADQQRVQAITHGHAGEALSAMNAGPHR